MLVYCQFPEKIEFDDDLVFCIDALLRKQKKLTTVLQEVFYFLKKFQIKNNGVLANLVNVLNSYIVFAGPFIQQSE